MYHIYISHAYRWAYRWKWKILYTNKLSYWWWRSGEFLSLDYIFTISFGVYLSQENSLYNSVLSIETVQIEPAQHSEDERIPITQLFALLIIFNFFQIATLPLAVRALHFSVGLPVVVKLVRRWIFKSFGIITMAVRYRTHIYVRIRLYSTTLISARR